MVLDSFHQFVALPFELRRMIYLLASPPRFVHVLEETEDRDDFEERFRTSLVPIQLRPSIAYFARHWRGRIPFPPVRWKWYDGRRQTTLERYGFDSPRSRNSLPWKPTRDVPEIPYNFLSENPDVAWEFLRTSSFYSTAPIPTMLHVTRESRHVLMGFGYELAFPTRSCGPRIWFNFKTDVLYLGKIEDREDRPFCDFLSGNKFWDVGQFDPHDLRRIRRIALESSADAVCFGNKDVMHGVSDILELLGSVEELFLEEFGWSYELSQHAEQENGRSLWVYAPVLEVDVLANVVYGSTPPRSTGYEGQELRAYKENNMGDGRDFFVDKARRFEETLEARRDELVRSRSLTPWRIPKATLGYILPQWMCKALYKWRWTIWNRHRALKEEEARSKAFEAAQRSIDVPRRPIDGNRRNEDSPPSPFSEAFRDDMEALEESLRQEDVRPVPADFYMSHLPIQRNWLLTATVPPPEN
ncbi:hypothetical protein F5B22DRAFT_633818 [Xylaria bambusicola]|uniref:uncharacterized protein n=1 Tax=Xylaria bambusicola TaxID=326684 RepID=UPI0020086D66|nr:uncharacterized protein F5B22DRAFT_633818 [Xylaria bambusicola]KAI0523690.1 hypothetical protein F5B22DRAFT_633818 [Xylaria bambusicola]